MSAPTPKKTFSKLLARAALSPPNRTLTPRSLPTTFTHMAAMPIKRQAISAAPKERAPASSQTQTAPKANPVSAITLYPSASVNGPMNSRAIMQLNISAEISLPTLALSMFSASASFNFTLPRMEKMTPRANTPEKATHAASTYCVSTPK
ncbi:MAG: hypothetical protein BWY09_00990 [Candidatus Hydrogenedentes bacterium ADurb.Bin179]|nr:MAG: hypothetical protein BWY09_00990 [Candidatus Hydrogenedentes bacterium ADurb.Bin179]